MAHTGSGNQGKPSHVCHHCGSTSTPCWRKGPADKPILCNACGARYLVKNSLDGYFPGSKSKVSVVQQGAVVKKPRAPKVPGTVKPKAFDNSRRLTGAASGAQVAMAFAPQAIVEPSRAQSWYPATNWPSLVVAIDEPLHASSGSSESDSMDLHLAYRGKDDASSVDSQEAVGDYSSAATVAELLQTRDLPAIKTAAAAVSRFHRGRPRKQAHPRACAL